MSASNYRQTLEDTSVRSTLSRTALGGQLTRCAKVQNSAQAARVGFARQQRTGKAGFFLRAGVFGMGRTQRECET